MAAKKGIALKKDKKLSGAKTLGGGNVSQVMSMRALRAGGLLGQLTSLRTLRKA